MNLEHLKRRLALAYYRATGGFPAKLAGGRYRLVPEDRKFWRKAASGQWERHTFRILDQLLRPDSVYVDVGAWIGPTVLFAAARCKVVYCIEPDAIAYERLLGNLRMNGIDNVLPFHGALGVRNGTVQIAGEKGFGTSETRVQATPVDGGADVAATVLAMDLPRFIQWWGIERIDLMKIDIEGAEFDLAPALIDLSATLKPATSKPATSKPATSKPATSKPAIHLSLHAPLFPQSERQAKLAAIVQLAECYAHCYDRDSNKIQPRDILEEPFVSRFREVVLVDEALG